jgi:hypothetical protein
MKVVSTEAQVWWIALADEIRARGGLNIREALARLKERFNFFSVPTQIPFPNEGGLTFAQGSLDGIVVTKLTMYPDGVNISVPTNTADAEAILTATLELFYSIGVRPPVTPPISYPVSFVVADFEKSLDLLLRPAPRIYEFIASKFAVSGQAHITGFGVNFDPQTLPPKISGLNPTMFRVERRTSVEYDKERYFCVANMTTDDHIAVLEDIERQL